MLVAELDRVTGYEPVGRGFESLQARQAPSGRAQIRGSVYLDREFFSASHSGSKSFHIHKRRTDAVIIAVQYSGPRFFLRSIMYLFNKTSAAPGGAHRAAVQFF